MGKSTKLRPQQQVRLKSVDQISDFKFDLLKWIFGTVLFFVGYYIFINKMERNVIQLIYIFGWNLLSNTIIELTFRLMYMKFTNLFTNIQEYIQNLIEALISSLLFYFGMFPYLSKKFGVDIYGSLTFQSFLQPALWEFFVWVLFIKLAIVFIADGLSDKIAFQSK